MTNLYEDNGRNGDLATDTISYRKICFLEVSFAHKIPEIKGRFANIKSGYPEL